MTTIPLRILDLFCSAGGASEGYRRAGFVLYGVDNVRQPHYPFAFHLGDALDVMAVLNGGGSVDFTHPDGSVESLTLADFVAVVGSPPCQAYSVTRHTHDKEHPELVEPTREAFVASGLPYVIENVPGAPLVDPLILCGSMFHLRAIDTDGRELALRRHRLFESNVWLVPPGGHLHDRTRVAGVYGGGSRDARGAGHDGTRGGYVPVARVARQLLGIDWMNRDELAQSIPPAYTEWIGYQLLEHVGWAA